MFQDILQEFEKCVSQMEADMDNANAALRWTIDNYQCFPIILDTAGPRYQVGLCLKITRKTGRWLAIAPVSRPLSVCFLFRTSGKQTDTATPLSMEKFGRINFSLARWVTEGKKRPNRWGNMPIELWDLSEFFFIHCCGRGSHFSKGHPSTCWKKY